MALSRAAFEVEFHKRMKYFGSVLSFVIRTPLPLPLPLPRINHRPATSCCRSGSMSGAWWFARWVLVLVLAFDYLSASFHHHQHDGIERQLDLATAHATFDDGDTHAEGEEHPLMSHATMAIRIDPSRLGQLPAADNADAPVALVSVVQLLAAFDEPPPTHWRPDRSRPDFRSHRSLPPAGRAPPLHA